jgi:hypothetical protein
LFNDQWVTDEINENTTYQNLWGTTKALEGGKFIAMSAYIKRTERSQINDLMLNLKLLEKQEKVKPKTSRRREIIKIRAEINEIEPKTTTTTTTTTTTQPYKKNQRNKKLVL